MYNITDKLSLFSTKFHSVAILALLQQILKRSLVY